MSLIAGLEGLTTNNQWSEVESKELGTFESLSTYEVWTRSDGTSLPAGKEPVAAELTEVGEFLEPPNDITITGGLKILVFQKWKSTPPPNDPKPKIIEKAVQALGVPLWIPARLLTHAFFCDPGNLPVGTTASIGRYWQRMRGGLLLWSHDPTTCTTRAIFLCRDIEYWHALRRVLDKCSAFASIPMLLGVLAYMQQIKISVDHIYYVRSQIDNLLESIDNNLSVNDNTSEDHQTSTDESSWSHDRLERFECQTRELVRDAQEAARSVPFLTNTRGNLSRISTSLTSMRAENQGYYKSSMSKLPERALLAQGLSGMIDAMMVELKSQILAADWIFSKIDSLIKNTNLTINRADQRSNIQIADSSHTIAVQSKRDNLSMMTIAAITMIFLPGTFVASLFAMPVLDWTIEQEPNAIQSGFWFYWAVTAPLTILTVLLWLTWFRRNTISKWWRNFRQQDDEAKRLDSQESGANLAQVNGSTGRARSMNKSNRTATSEKWITPRGRIDWSNEGMAPR